MTTRRILTAWFAATAFLLLLSCRHARAQDDQEPISIESADYMRHDRQNQTTLLRGDVVVKFRDSTIQANEAVVNEKYKTTTANGRVIVEDSKGSIFGSSIYYDYDKEYFEITDPVGSTTSNTVQGRMYYSGRMAKGTRNKIKIIGGEFTTCDPYCSEEYHVHAKEITVIPDVKVVAKNVTFYIHKVPAFFLPYYVVSLKAKKENNLPEFGYNKVEGYYMKARQVYMAKELITGILILNYMSRKGTGYGAEHKYYLKQLGGNGSSRIYTNNEKDTGFTTNDTQFDQAFKSGPKTNGTMSWTRHNTYSLFQNRNRTNSNSMSLNMNRVVNIVGGTGTSGGGQKLSQTLSYFTTGQHGIYQQQNTNMTYTHTQQFKGNVRTQLNTNYTEQAPGGLPKNRVMNLQLNATKTHKMYTLDYALRRNYDLAKRPGTAGAYFSDVRPEMTLTLAQGAYQKVIPARYIPLTLAKATFGNYWEGSHASSRHIRRYSSQLTASKALPIGKKSSLTPTYDWRQYFYQTKDAMYATVRTLDYKYAFTPATILAMTHTKTASAGGHPFSQDIMGYSEYLRGSLASSHARSNLSFTTGYDYVSNLYDPLTMQYTRSVTQNSNMNFATSYDLNDSIWAPTTTGLLLSRKNMKLNISGVWNTKKLDFVSGGATLTMARKNGWEFNLRAEYTRKSLYPILRDIVAIKTNCCTQIQMAYHTETDFFEFQYVILAFPAQRMGFTSSDQGLQLDESILPQEMGGQGGPSLF